MSDTTPRRPVPTSVPVLRSTLKFGALLALAIGVVGAVVGGLVAGGPGIASALVGAAMALLFLGLTIVSILFANRFMGSELFVGAFFGIVLGGWLVKFALFIVAVLVLKGQPWVHPGVLYASLVVAVIGMLVVDVIVISRSRTPYVDAAPSAERPLPPEGNIGDRNSW